MEIETTENNINELISRIDARYGKMSKGQKRLADYVKGNYDKAVFLTAAKLGEIVGVVNLLSSGLPRSLDTADTQDFKKHWKSLSAISSIRSREWKSLTGVSVRVRSLKRYCSLI